MGGAFERLFCPEGREFEQTNLQKFKCTGVARGGGMLKFQFDWYINKMANLNLRYCQFN